MNQSDVAEAEEPSELARRAGASTCTSSFGVFRCIDGLNGFVFNSNEQTNKSTSLFRPHPLQVHSQI